MAKKLTPDQKKAAIFKGTYIDGFLKIEYSIERIIIHFFQGLEFEKGVFSPVYLNDIIKNKNKMIKNFFDHFLFIDPFYTTKQKIAAVSTIIHLLILNRCTHY
jgi:hypothetical protein